LLPKDTLFVTILDPLSDGELEQLRRRQQLEDHPYPVREGTARKDDDVVRGSGIEVLRFPERALASGSKLGFLKEK